MQRHFLILVIGTIISIGCAARTPVTLETINPNLQNQQSPSSNDPHRLWGEFKLFIDAAHDKVDVVPQREARFHLNALKFLESYCADCLKITGIKNNGDGTIDLTVQIAHPFKGFPQYTGFDVKGIIMFNGSHEIPGNMKKMPLYPANYLLSWRLMGDPELLNADGYTYLWSPWYDSGSEMPIFNYWPGRHSNGKPTANVNGFLNFYSNENRHMFECGAIVRHTYHIWLPPGPVVAGYAIDACWEPPTVTPVTDPATDFPISANQPECYHFKCVLNNGLPVVDGDPCIGNSVWESRAELKLWYVLPPADEDTRWVGAWNEELVLGKAGNTLFKCDSLPDHPDWGCIINDGIQQLPKGVHQFFGYEFHASIQQPQYKVLYPTFDVFEVTIDLQ